MDQRNTERARTTRDAIVQAALRGFSEKGFAATSTREIAALAGTNVASIAYHFGGKEGLRTACAAHIVGLMGGVLADGDDDEAPTDPAAAEARLRDAVRNIASFLLLEPQAQVLAGFMLRELADPSAALDLVYDGIFEKVHRRLCRMWGIATNRMPEGDAIKLAVFALIGQVIYFRIGAPIVARRLAWRSVGPAEVEAIIDTVTRNLVARLEADRREA